MIDLIELTILIIFFSVLNCVSYLKEKLRLVATDIFKKLSAAKKNPVNITKSSSRKTHKRSVLGCYFFVSFLHATCHSQIAQAYSYQEFFFQ